MREYFCTSLLPHPHPQERILCVTVRVALCHQTNPPLPEWACGGSFCRREVLESTGEVYLAPERRHMAAVNQGRRIRRPYTIAGEEIESTGEVYLAPERRHMAAVNQGRRIRRPYIQWRARHASPLLRVICRCRARGDSMASDRSTPSVQCSTPMPRIRHHPGACSPRSYTGP